MTNLTRKFATAIATGALLTQAVAPIAFASTEITISGNGAGSDNVVGVTQASTTTVTQTNNASVNNSVNANANTGKNDANFNTGGNVTVKTGDAEVNAHVSNDLNKNVADVENCNCGQDTEVKISGNGAFSDNTVGLTNTNGVALTQGNNANVRNDVNVKANTGKNDAGFNTGGDVVIMTGDAETSALVETNANSNWAKIGGGHGGNSGVSLEILNNGAGSDNLIDAALANSTYLSQGNVANIHNNVDANANTGKNDANFNTGEGYVVIDTGDAEVNAWIDNNVNFNAADVDCGCVYDLHAKIAGNGAEVGHNYNSEADNKILAALANVQSLGQANLAEICNDLDGYFINTGKNEASKNTQGGEDPAVLTGDALVNVGIENDGNTNVLGDLDFPTVELPELDFDWDWVAMWSFFGMSHNA